VKYEARVNGGKILWLDGAGRFYKLENNNIFSGFAHIFKSRAD
jgi:hypothetical protein